MGETADRWDGELAAESIVVRVRWFGILAGALLVAGRSGLHDPAAVGACLGLGAVYATLDTIHYRRGAIFLRQDPLFVSLMESAFIALLCYNDTQVASPFRWYYLLSILCCALRYPRGIAWTTCGLHCLSFAGLAWWVRCDRSGAESVAETVAILLCVCWAGSSLAAALRDVGARLERANRDLEGHRDELEARVAERTSALRAAQARVIHQEKMATFGLLAAGIAHEVGNPLAGLSSLIQMLRRRDPDPYTDAKLGLAETQLGRIQRTIRELVDYSRPASPFRGRVRPIEVVDEALGIAKYYQRTKNRAITVAVPDDLDPVRGVRDHLTQILLNLILNAIDATGQGGRIAIEATSDGRTVALSVVDDGRGIAELDRPRVFQPYFTTKPSGTGLGLFVSRQVVDEMGGTLDFASAPGRTAFTVRLPVHRAEVASPMPSTPTAARVEEVLP